MFGKKFCSGYDDLFYDSSIDYISKFGTDDVTIETVANRKEYSNESGKKCPIQTAGATAAYGFKFTITKRDENWAKELSEITEKSLRLSLEEAKGKDDVAKAYSLKTPESYITILAYFEKALATEVKQVLSMIPFTTTSEGSEKYKLNNACLFIFNCLYQLGLIDSRYIDKIKKIVGGKGKYFEYLRSVKHLKYKPEVVEAAFPLCHAFVCESIDKISGSTSEGSFSVILSPIVYTDFNSKNYKGIMDVIRSTFPMKESKYRRALTQIIILKALGKKGFSELNKIVEFDYKGVKVKAPRGIAMLMSKKVLFPSEESRKGSIYELYGFVLRSLKGKTFSFPSSTSNSNYSDFVTEAAKKINLVGGWDNTGSKIFNSANHMSTQYEAMRGMKMSLSDMSDVNNYFGELSIIPFMSDYNGAFQAYMSRAVGKDIEPVNKVSLNLSEYYNFENATSRADSLADIENSPEYKALKTYKIIDEFMRSSIIYSPIMQIGTKMFTSELIQAKKIAIDCFKMIFKNLGYETTGGMVSISEQDLKIEDGMAMLGFTPMKELFKFTGEKDKELEKLNILRELTNELLLIETPQAKREFKHQILHGIRRESEIEECPRENETISNTEANAESGSTKPRVNPSEVSLRPRSNKTNKF